MRPTDAIDTDVARQRVRVGPFVADRHPFIVDTNQFEFAEAVADRLGDLRADGPGGTPVVFRVDRRGAAWLSHPWGLWRDGEPCETTLTDDYILPYVLWEVTRLVLEGAAPAVPIHAAAVTRCGRALVLAGPSHAGKSTLAAWLTWRGWGFLTDEVAVLDTPPGQPAVIHPFPRPVGVRRGGPVDAVVHLAGQAPEVLVPASELGTLAGPAPLAAVVLPAYTPGGGGDLEPLSPAAALTAVCGHLPSLREEGRRVFRAVADVVADVPSFSLAVDDLDVAERALARLMDGLR